MKRVVNVRVPNSHGKIDVKLVFDHSGLMADEQQHIVNQITDSVVGAVRNIPYSGTTPLSQIRIS